MSFQNRMWYFTMGNELYRAVIGLKLGFVDDVGVVVMHIPVHADDGFNVS